MIGALSLFQLHPNNVTSTRDPDRWKITADAELCQIFALLRVCGRTPAGLFVLGPKSDGPNRTIFDVWCSDPYMLKLLGI